MKRNFGRVRDSVNIEDPEVLAGQVDNLLDPKDFLEEIMSGTYERSVNEAHEYAWVKTGLSAVPSFRMDGRSLDASEDVGVTKQQLADFLKG